MLLRSAALCIALLKVDAKPERRLERYGRDFTKRQYEAMHSPLFLTVIRVAADPACTLRAM